MKMVPLVQNNEPCIPPLRSIELEKQASTALLLKLEDALVAVEQASHCLQEMSSPRVELLSDLIVHCRR